MPGAKNVVFGEVVADNGFRVMAYDVPGADEPVVAGEPTTRKENGTTITTEPVFVSVQGESLEEVGPIWERQTDVGPIDVAYLPPELAQPALRRR
ncbi:hypothetical protein ACSHWB_33020 [Lentzea sp. HUAS TT2]|uniref:hypothetical protein n=1 Tax=Lentzea sp. HUAS TT2 TaxID=3447454 RepID=UPI003F70253A